MPTGSRWEPPASFLMPSAFLSPLRGSMRSASRSGFFLKRRLESLHGQARAKWRASDVRGDLRTPTKAGKIRRVSRARQISETQAGGYRRIHRHRSLLEQARERSPAVSFDLARRKGDRPLAHRSEEHTSELLSLRHLVCRLLLEKKK